MTEETRRLERKDRSSPTSRKMVAGEKIGQAGGWTDRQMDKRTKRDRYKGKNGPAGRDWSMSEK